jgi:hypothetical protein
MADGSAYERYGVVEDDVYGDTHTRLIVVVRSDRAASGAGDNQRVQLQMRFEIVGVRVRASACMQRAKHD